MSGDFVSPEFMNILTVRGKSGRLNLGSNPLPFNLWNIKGVLWRTSVERFQAKERPNKKSNRKALPLYTIFAVATERLAIVDKPDFEEKELFNALIFSCKFLPPSVT
jgi:hypothetical protein